MESVASEMALFTKLYFASGCVGIIVILGIIVLAWFASK